jgi:hypothetical protein
MGNEGRDPKLFELKEKTATISLNFLHSFLKQTDGGHELISFNRKQINSAAFPSKSS